MAATNAGGYKVTLYHYRGCPYSHRVHIALAELGVQHDQVHIDLDKPREAWYLKVNPHGLVPALQIASPALGGEHLLIESHIITQFLADVVPDVLIPSSSKPAGAFTRARVNYFIDTWNTKVGTYMFHLFRAQTTTDREQFAKDWVAAIQKEIEPLLADAAPFFGGSKRLTLAEVSVAPFVLRIWALAAADIIPQAVTEALTQLPNFGRWATNVMRQPSVRGVWNEPQFVDRTQSRLQKMREANKPAKTAVEAS